MRTAIVLTIVVLSLPIAFLRPFYGTMLWSWASYFRPHDLAWGLNYPLSKYIAAATLGGFLVALPLRREKFPNLFVREVFLMIFILLALILVCDAALYDTKAAWEKFSDYWKIFLMVFLTIAMVNTKDRMRWALWAIALSLGLLGFKGGFLGALRGAKIQGPGGFIRDNNDFALVLNMALPILFYLARTEKLRTHRLLFGWTTFFTAIAVVLTHSRGGFLGMCAVAMLLAIKSNKKALAFGGMGVLVLVGASLLPVIAPDWIERIQSIQDYEQDGSARGRFNAWATCWNIGLARPLTGVGPRNLDLEQTFQRFSPHPEDRHVAHNIYFQTLSDGGFTLLVPFMLLLISTYLTCWRLRRRTPNFPENQWFINYCHMFEVSLAAYAVSGFFLSRNDFDLMYHIVGLVVCLKLMHRKVVVFSRPQAVTKSDEANDGPRAPLAPQWKRQPGGSPALGRW